MGNRAKNIHATALVIGETGVLITGASGSGKSRLALDFLQSAVIAGKFAALVADDQVFLERLENRLMAIAPEPTRGLIEIRGSAIIKVACMDRAIMHLVISTASAGQGDRLPDLHQRQDVLPGVSMPLLHMVPGQMKNPIELLAAFDENRLLL